jgi:hypothetical protein
MPSDHPIEQQIEAWQVYFDAVAEGEANAHKRGVRRARRFFPWFRGPRFGDEGSLAERLIAEGRVIVGRISEPSEKARRFIEFWASHGVSPAPRLGFRSERGALGDHLFKGQPLPDWFAATIAREKVRVS